MEEINVFKINYDDDLFLNIFQLFNDYSTFSEHFSLYSTCNSLYIHILSGHNPMTCCDANQIRTLDLNMAIPRQVTLLPKSII